MQSAVTVWAARVFARVPLRPLRHVRVAAWPRACGPHVCIISSRSGAYLERYNAAVAAAVSSRGAAGAAAPEVVVACDAVCGRPRAQCPHRCATPCHPGARGGVPSGARGVSCGCRQARAARQCRVRSACGSRVPAGGLLARSRVDGAAATRRRRGYWRRVGRSVARCARRRRGTFLFW